MTLLLIISILIRVAAVVWSVILLRRLRDWRMGFLTLMLAFMTYRQCVTLMSQPQWWPPTQKGIGAEWSGLVVSVLAFLAVVFLARFLTERKQAEARLRDTLQMADDLVQFIPSGMLIYQYVEPDKLYLLSGNPETEKLTGVKVADLIGQEFNESWPGAEASGLTKAYLEVMRTGRSFATDDCSYKDEKLVGAFRIRAFRLPNNRLAVSFENITERKQAEAALHESEARFAGAFHTSPAAITITRVADGTFIDANQSFLDLFEFSRDEVIGRTSTELGILTAEERGPLIRAQVESGGLRNAELVARSRSGRPIHLLFSSKPMQLAGEVHHVTTLIDITARKQAEAALRESEERLRLFAEQAPAPIAMLDENLNYVAASQRWLSGHGWKDRDLIGRNMYEAFPDIPERWKEIHRRCLSGAVESSEADPWVRADGGTDWIRWEMRPWRKRDGAIGGLVVFSEDITADKKVEVRLHESEERLRLALDAAHMGTFDWDVPGNRITWSRWHEELWGFKPGEFGGTYEAFSERVHPDDLPGINAEVARCIAAREPFTREFRVVWPDGSVHWVIGQGEFTFGADGTPVRMRGVVKEITERKLAEAALRELTGRLLRLQDEERRRIARELHDTTAQNLAALTLGLAALQNAPPNADERTDQALEACRALAEQSARELRTVSYLLHPPLLDDFGLARAAQDYTDGFSRRSGIRVDLDLPPAWRRLDRDRELALFRVLQESLSNVHRHSGSATVSVRLAETDEGARLEVQDAGRGLPGDAGSLGGVQAGVGVLGMSERMQQLGGRLEIKSGLPGTLVRAMVPRGAEEL